MTGIYCYDPEVFKVIRTLEPSGRGELEITDVNNWYVNAGVDGIRRPEGFWGDAGESIDAYYEVNDFVRSNGVNKRSTLTRASSRQPTIPAERFSRQRLCAPIGCLG